LLPAPTAPSEGSAGVRNLVDRNLAAYLPALDPGSPAQASLSILQLPLARSPADLPDYVARKLAGPSTGPACWNSNPKTELPAKTARCSAALLGVAALASRFAHQAPKNPGTASRERQLPLPAPLPGWPRKEPESSSHCLPAEIGPSVACRTLLAVSDPPGRLRRPSRSPRDHAPPLRVGEAKYLVISLWITGKSGNNNWNLFE
jgi:hypothetical protein